MASKPQRWGITAREWANYALQRYEFRARWHRLSALGTSPIVRLSMLMPVAGYLIVLNGEFLRYADIDPRFKLLATEWPWRLVAFYFGTLCIGGASAIFSWRCDLVLKYYRSAVEYTNAEVEFFKVHHHSNPIYEALWSANISLPDWKRQKQQFARLANVSGQSRGYRAVPEHVLVEAMTMHWHIVDMNQTGWRLLCRALYDLGLGILLVPTVATLLGVLAFVTTRFI